MKKPPINNWEMGRLFGVWVVRGEVKGRPVAAQVRWWANNRFGVTHGGYRWVEEIWKVGRPAKDPFPGLTP